MQKQRLILDFDGTITDSIASIVSLYNEDFRYYAGFTPVAPESIKTWGMVELELANPWYIDALWNQPRFFERLQFMHDGEEVIRMLSSQYSIEVASMCPQPNGIGKERWIQKHMPYISKIHIINPDEFTDKSHLDMSNAIFIDDNMKYLSATNAKKKICFGKVYEWNKGWDGLRCANWNEVAAELLLDD